MMAMTGEDWSREARKRFKAKKNIEPGSNRTSSGCDQWTAEMHSGVNLRAPVRRVGNAQRAHRPTR
jgi:hypothetical protein